MMKLISMDIFKIKEGDYHMIKFTDTLETFLSERKEGKFYDSSIITYRRKLEVFFEYLHIKCGINDSNYEDLLRGLANERIIKSIEYYVNEYDIKFKITVDSYFVVIKCYFDFLSSKYKIKNENFDSTQKFSELKKLVEKRIKEMKLNMSKQKMPIMKTSFDDLNKYCNQKIDMLSKEELIKNQIIDSESYNKPLVEFISAIITKIVMLTGVKNQVIGELMLKDLDTELNRIKINNYWIHLPDKLGLQLRKYLGIRNEIIKDKSNESPLFINKKGESVKKRYDFMFEVMKPIIGNKQAESVAKFTIMNMIKKGINSSIIQELTSFGIDTYLHCQELVDEEKNKQDLRSKIRYLDSKIRDMEIFDEL